MSTVRDATYELWRRHGMTTMFGNPGSAAAHVKSGKLRALAVSSAKPSALDPTLPPIAATIPGYELVELLGLFAPAKTPTAIVSRWNEATARFLNNAEVKQTFLLSGSEIVTGSSQEFTADMKSDMSKFCKIIKDASLAEK
jgi:tripartite-type tricarboxylate transporter receptor subunit TctC